LVFLVFIKIVLTEARGILRGAPQNGTTSPTQPKTLGERAGRTFENNLPPALGDDARPLERPELVGSRHVPSLLEMAAIKDRPTGTRLSPYGPPSVMLVGESTR